MPIYIDAEFRALIEKLDVTFYELDLCQIHILILNKIIYHPAAIEILGEIVCLQYAT